MKNRILTAAIAAIVAGAAMFITGKGCADAPAPVVVERTVTVEAPPMTVQLPGRIVYRPAKPQPPATDSVALAKYRAEIARLRRQLMESQMQLAEYEYQTALADTAYDRTMVVLQGETRQVVPWRDSLQLAYDYPPLNRFSLTQQGSTVITLPVTESAASADAGRPWWVDVLIAVVGAAAAVTGQAITK